MAASVAVLAVQHDIAATMVDGGVPNDFPRGPDASGNQPAMNEREDRSGGEAGTGRDGRLALAFVYCGALAAFIALSRYMLVARDTVVTLRNNVLFETDTSVRLRYLADAGAEAVGRLELAQHPALFYVWRPIGRLLSIVLTPLLPAGEGRVLAAQLLVCGFAATAATFLFNVARRWRAGTVRALLVTAVFVLATSSVLLVVPEHWAMASALMLACFAGVSAAGPLSVWRGVWLALLAGLITLTTVTNAIFATLVGMTHLRRAGWKRAERAAWVAIGLAGIAGLAVIVPRLVGTRAVAGFFNFRLWQAPIDAAVYTVFALVGSITGPVPRTSVEREHIVLSYEPISFALYSPVQWAGVIAWAVLLGFCIWQGLRTAETRGWSAWLLAWIAFNVLFHNIWGDEFFLYSPHYVWALIVVVAISARRIPVPVLATAVALITTAQIYAFWTIGQLARTPV